MTCMIEHIVPGSDLYSTDPDPVQHLTTTDTACAVDVPYDL